MNGIYFLLQAAHNGQETRLEARRNGHSIVACSSSLQVGDSFHYTLRFKILCVIIESNGSGFPLGPENLEKWEGIFQSGKSPGKSHKILDKLGNSIQILFLIFSDNLYYLLKCIKFSVEK